MTREQYAKLHLSAMYGMACYPANRLPLVVICHVRQVILDNKPSPTDRGEPLAYEFYIDRFMSIPKYGEKSGTELLKLVCRCAFADNVLTEAESISIINICHSPEWYKIFKEMNFNEGWN